MYSTHLYCIFVYIHVQIYMYVYIDMHVYMHHAHTHTHKHNTHTHICMRICMCICICICIYIYVGIYMYMYICICRYTYVYICADIYRYNYAKKLRFARRRVAIIDEGIALCVCGHDNYSKITICVFAAVVDRSRPKKRTRKVLIHHWRLCWYHDKIQYESCFLFAGE